MHLLFVRGESSDQYWRLSGVRWYGLGPTPSEEAVVCSSGGGRRNRSTGWIGLFEADSSKIREQKRVCEVFTMRYDE